MKVPRHILAEAIAQRTLQVKDAGLLAKEIAAYLLAEHRTGELEPILRDIMQYRLSHGVLEAEVVTAHDVTADVLKQVKQILRATHPSADTVHLAKRQDPSVVGGLRVDMANEQLDLSVSNRLSTFKRLISEGTS